MHVVYLLIACDVIKNQAARGQITEQFKDHLYTHQERNMMGECDIKNTSFVLNTKWQLVWEAGRADSVGRTASVFTADREEGGQQRLKDSRSALYWEPETTRRTAPIVLLCLSIVNPLGRWSNPIDNAPLQWMDALPTEKRDCFNPSIVWLCWWRMRRLMGKSSLWKTRGMNSSTLTTMWWCFNYKQTLHTGNPFGIISEVRQCTYKWYIWPVSVKFQLTILLPLNTDAF